VYDQATQLPLGLDTWLRSASRAGTVVKLKVELTRMSNLTDFDADVDSPSGEWRQLSKEHRLLKVASAIDQMTQFSTKVEVVDTGESGEVIVTLRENLAAAERGTTLLDLEEFLKVKVDRGINVWCEPVADKSAIRKLRGVKIEAIRVGEPSKRSETQK